MGIFAEKYNTLSPPDKYWLSGTNVSSCQPSGIFADVIERGQNIFKAYPPPRASVYTCQSSGVFDKFIEQGQKYVVTYHPQWAVETDFPRLFQGGNISDWILLADLPKVMATLYKENMSGAAAWIHRLQYHAQLNILASSGVNNTSRLVARLNSLLHMAIEDEPGNLSPIRIESLSSMVEFFISVGIQSYPDLALTPDGNIFTAWEDRSAQKSTQIVFLPDGMLRILFVQKGEGISRRKKWISGTIGIAESEEFLRTNNALPE